MVRTTARGAATTVLAQAGGTVAVTDHDLLAVSGLLAGQIAELLGGAGVPFSGLAPHQATLEEAYMELTRDSVQFRGAPPTLEEAG
jgi:ABC-2 type transport system ATP-binding protein